MAQKPRSKSQGSKPKTSKRQQAMDPSISLAWVWREFKGEFPQSEDEKERLAQLELNFKKYLKSLSRRMKHIRKAKSLKT